MKKPVDIFCEIPSLTNRSKQLKGTDLHKKWFKSADKRIIGQYLQKFINYNSTLFNFLGVQPYIVGSDREVSLVFQSSEYIGAIPLRSPDTGKQIGDFVVTPRYSGHDKYEDYIEILNLLDTEINPEVIDSLPLASGRNFRPPLYLSAIKFIITLDDLLKKPWRKFDSIKKRSNEPIGQINWSEYVKTSYKVENRLSFPIKKNTLNEFHEEFAEIRYIYNICKAELLSSNTPLRIKNKIRNQLELIDKKLYFHKPKVVRKIRIKSSDSLAVSKCKEHANKILNFNLIESTGWKVDFSDVFEKFIQHIFKMTAKETGGRLLSNFKIHSNNIKRYSWELKHIEPDAIYQKNNLLIFIDAKYKSNLYNRHEKGDKLKDDHRHDLHQILAYSSFSKADYKYGFLCYPANKLEMKTVIYKNRLNEVKSTIIIFGVPLKKDVIPDAKKLLTEKLNEIETQILY